MKKAMLIIILSAMLTACGTTESTVKEEPTAVTSAVSLTTTTAAETASKTVTSSQTTATTTVTTAKTTTTTKPATTTKAETGKSKETTTTRSSVTTTLQTQPAEVQTYIVYYDEPVPETQQPEVKATETTTTTVQTRPPAADTTAAPTATKAPESTVTWSDSMKIWRKLCECQKLTGSEQDIIRSEILDYAVDTFNGKKDIHVSFGMDAYDISYEKPLKITIRSDMKDMSYAHMDAHTDPDSKWLIDCASGDKEIYDIVSDTRQSCLHVIDQGLFNRWEIFSACDQLKYASTIECNVGFDDDGYIWFLTED